ncbi:hypothetical protein QAD02_006662 [Eretmocerus hayati]|uniref:Uncharacterized protein n=1 Tax=Eretmocerus hayati TaxID=131215 RepID=A0ACC2N1G0_9HYME|nr:hypothetical protein QAD02_006662 [Eretmocerus hayati]
MDHHYQQSRKQMVSPEVAMAAEVFDQFCNAATLKSILGHFRHLCDLLKIKPTNIHQFYPKLKSKLRSWKAQALWKKFDQRANHKCYNRGKACLNTRVLIIGGGPCGMRSAIEAQLLGAKVVVVEKRDRMSRNNVLHLWPFVIHDLRGLGAKKFFGKFCAGSIDHISIRQLQCILLKVALILGVEFHENVSFESLVPPPEDQEGGKIGWRAETTPADHPVSQYEFDVLIGADGKRNTLEGFKRKEFRGKLAIAITANFINKRTEAEARVEEISGVAFIFNQKFFKELYSETGIDLENIVYYKDDTHYFVMTAKKHSLIDKGVILQDHPDTAKLLAKENVDREALMMYAREAAEFSTEYQMMDMEFAVNHYGQPDVAMFDFTSMYAAENASRVLERRGHRLLQILVGDSLLEPFWPTGSGCARGFLSSLDAGWAIKAWGAGLTPLEVIAERESIYRLLGQTTPENLNRDYAAYTLDPHTRYPNLNVRCVTSTQVRTQLDTDDPETFKLQPVQTAIDLPKKRRRRDSQVHPETLLHWLQRQVALYDGVRIHDMGASFKSGLAIAAIINRYRPDLVDFHALKKDDPAQLNQLVFDVLEKELGITSIMTGEEMVQSEVPDKLLMFSYLTQIYEAFRGEIPHIKHPKLEPETEERPSLSQKLSELSHKLAEQKTHLMGSRTRRSRHSNENLPPSGDKKLDSSSRRHTRKRRSTEKMGATVDREPKLHAGHRRGSIDEGFSGRIKNIEDKLRGTAATEKKPKDLLRAIGKIEKSDWNVKEIEKKIEENKMGRGVKHEKVERVPKWSREQFLARQTKMEKRGKEEPMETESKYAEIDSTLKNIDRKIREGNVLGHNKVSAMAEQFASKNQETDAPGHQVEQSKVQRSNSKAALALPAQGGSETCHFCEKRVYLMERLTAEGKSFHRGCFKCEYCSTSLRIGNHTFDRDKNGGRFYCTQHFGLPGTMKTRSDRKKLPLTNKENIPHSSNNLKSLDKTKLSVEGISGLDLLDRGQTPERIEFENLAGISDAEDAHSIMDEDEWTDRNFGPSAAEMGSSDDISDMSDSDEDNEVFEEAIDQPLTTEGTLELAKNWTLRYSHPHPAAANSDTGSNEYEDSSDEYTSTEEDSQTATEDEDDARARELRKQEVWLKLPPRSSDTETGSETEQIGSDDDSSTSSSSGSENEEENSATEISTDSEFEHDGTTPTRHEIPEITINDSYVRKTRGDYVEPKKVQIKSRLITPVNGSASKNNETSNKRHQLTKQQQETSKLNALNDSSNSAQRQQQQQTTSNRNTTANSPLINPRKGDYLLSRTHSTEGIASRLSLELKKRYLLGGSGLGNSVVKSGSTSNVDTRLRNLSDAISQHQKLLNPAPEPSPSMQAFLHGTNKLRQPLSPLSPSAVFATSAPVISPSARPFNFDVKSLADSTTSDPSAQKTQQLPDLIKESSSANNLEGKLLVPNRKSPIIEEKSISSEDAGQSPKESDIALLKSETPTPIVEVKSISEAVVHPSPTPLVNGETSIPQTGSSVDQEESRSRSPLHETSIIVPQVDWDKNRKKEASSSSSTSDDDDSEMDSDSLSSSAEEEIKAPTTATTTTTTTPSGASLSPPRLQIHSTDGDLLLDEQVERHREEIDPTASFEPDSIECSYLLHEENQIPKSINNPDLEIANSCLKQLQLTSAKSSPCSSRHDDVSENDPTTAALTETEMSEWARDNEGLVSEDLRDVEFDMNPQSIGSKRPSLGTQARIANGEDLTDVELDFSLEELAPSCQQHQPSSIASKLLANGDEDIGFMDTDNESLLEEDSLKDTGFTRPRNRGYVEFVSLQEQQQQQQQQQQQRLRAPIARLDAEQDAGLDSEDALTPCCERMPMMPNVIHFDPVTMDDVRDRIRMNGLARTVPHQACEIKVTNAEGQTTEIESVNKDMMSLSMDEDSLTVAEQHEDTTTSELLTVLASPINPEKLLGKDDLLDDETPSEATKTPEPAPMLETPTIQEDATSPDYLEYVKRLQNRIAEFSNAKDSIDVRKSKRNRNSPPFVESIPSFKQSQHQEELIVADTNGNGELGEMGKSPARKLEQIIRERSREKTVIQDLLMDKLEAHKQRSAEKRAKRAARTASFSTLPTTPVKLPPTSELKDAGVSVNGHAERNGFPSIAPIERPTSLILECSNVSDNFSSSQRLPDGFATPLAPPRTRIDEARKTAEKARADARERARLKSDEDLGLSPEERLRELRQKVARRQLKSETDGTPKATTPSSSTKRYSFGLRLQTSKSTDNVKAARQQQQMRNGSLDELLDGSPKRGKKSKDPERRKSIIQAVSDFFKKKDSPPKENSRLSVFRLTPKSKDKNKLDKLNPQLDKRPKSVCEGMLNIGSFFIESPPPVPPPPLNYGISNNLSGVELRGSSSHLQTDESLSEEDSKTAALSGSLLNKPPSVVDGGSCNSIPRKTKNAKRVARQAQLKRLRMAQEIQRKLEETEVKQRELENRGVSVEKSLRGEGESSDREEADLLREWFDLMRERTELRRYEKELLVRAQEVQLEDRHDRLQQELRERLADDDEKKTSADVKKEGEILTEMLEIVAKRDSLIALLEEERQRYQDEDRDLEAQMLSKGLALSPVNKRGSKYSI